MGAPALDIGMAGSLEWLERAGAIAKACISAALYEVLAPSIIGAALVLL